MQYLACKSLDVPTDVLFCHWEELSHMAVSSCSAFGHYRAAFLDTMHWVRHLVYSGRVTQTLLTRWWAGFLLLLECHHVINCEDMYVCGQFDMDLSKLCHWKTHIQIIWYDTHSWLGQRTLSTSHKKNTSISACTGTRFIFTWFWPQVSKEVNIATPRLIQWDWSTSLMILIGITKLVEWPRWCVNFLLQKICLVFMTSGSETGLLFNITRWFMIIFFFPKRVFKKFISVSLDSTLDSTRPVVDSTPFLVDTWPRRKEKFTRKVN